MATLVYGLNQSLDGYVDHTAFMPGPVLFGHFIEHAKSLDGSLYGRRMYETMRYWDDEQPGWSEDEREFAKAWCAQPKWVVSRTLDQVGPNATLVRGDLPGFVAELKARYAGEIEVAGPELAGHLTELGLIDEYRIYLHPYVIGQGKRFFVGPRPPLRLVSSDRVDENVLRLVYRPARTASA